MAILIRNARVLTFDEAGQEYARADVLSSGHKIVAVGPDLRISDFLNFSAENVEVIDGAGKLVMPGLINAHLHSPANFLKGAIEDFPLEIFMLYEVPPMGDTPLSARLYYLRAMLGAMEMLKLGVTSVHDDAFFNPTPLPECVDSVMAAPIPSIGGPSMAGLISMTGIFASAAFTVRMEKLSDACFLNATLGVLPSGIVSQTSALPAESVAISPAIAAPD